MVSEAWVFWGGHVVLKELGLFPPLPWSLLARFWWVLGMMPSSAARGNSRTHHPGNNHVARSGRPCGKPFTFKEMLSAQILISLGCFFTFNRSPSQKHLGLQFAVRGFLQMFCFPFFSSVFRQVAHGWQLPRLWPHEVMALNRNCQTLQEKKVRSCTEPQGATGFVWKLEVFFN